jgi:hypothetical protein
MSRSSILHKRSQQKLQVSLALGEFIETHTFYILGAGRGRHILLVSTDLPQLSSFRFFSITFGESL